MITVLLYILLILLTIIICAYFLDVLLTGKTPLVVTPPKVLKVLSQEIQLKDSSVFYDLGSGTGNTLLYLSNNYPATKFIGIDNSFISCLISRVLMRFKHVPNITVINKNFFDVDLSKATHLYSWIIVSDMDKLLPKLRKELKPGTLLYSLDFPFTHMSPIKTLDFGNTHMFGRKLYTYEF